MKRSYAGLGLIATLVVIASVGMYLKARQDAAASARWIKQGQDEAERARLAMNKSARDAAHRNYAQLVEIAKLNKRLGQNAQLAEIEYELTLARLQRERDEKLEKAKD